MLQLFDVGLVRSNVQDGGEGVSQLHGENLLFRPAKSERKIKSNDQCCHGFKDAGITCVTLLPPGLVFIRFIHG